MLVVALVVGVCAAGPDYYTILDVERGAPAADIRKAYRRLALKWHPDKSEDPQAPARFREIAEAYEVLGDPARRQQYDGGVAGGVGFDPGDFGFAFRDADEIFRDFFGGEDPFAEANKAFEEAERMFADVRQQAKEAEASAGGLFSIVSSFFSSFSGGSSGERKTVTTSTETRVGPDGQRVMRTVSRESSGGEKAVPGHITEERLATAAPASEAMTGEESGGVGGPPPVATLAEDAGAQCHGTAPGCRSQVDEAASLGAPPEVPTQPASEQAPAAPHEAPRPRPHGKESPPEAPLEAPAEEQPRLQTMAQQAATPPEVPQQEAPPTPPKKPQQQQQSPPEARPTASPPPRGRATPVRSPSSPFGAGVGGAAAGPGAWAARPLPPTAATALAVGSPFPGAWQPARGLEGASRLGLGRSSGASPFAPSPPGGDACDGAFVEGVQPADSTVLHVPGSGCCAPSAQTAPTDRRGCCQRCMASEACEVFVWQPSAGTCWLMRWKDPSAPVLARAPDRVMGQNPVLAAS